MLEVWKFPIPIQDEFELEMPRLAQILCVQVQRDQPCIWALVDPQERPHQTFFRLAGTGQLIEGSEDDYIYVGTFQLQGGSLVFHLFEDMQ